MLRIQIHEVHFLYLRKQVSRKVLSLRRDKEYKKG